MTLGGRKIVFYIWKSGDVSGNWQALSVDQDTEHQGIIKYTYRY